MTVHLAPLVLLVEDDEDLAESYVRNFGKAGVAVDRASGWEEALGLFRVAGHELVIVDYNLDDPQHGLRLLMRMKHLMPSSKLILISGAFSPKAEQIATTVGFIDGFHAKTPNLFDTLLQEAQVVLNRAANATDWQRFAAGYLLDPAADDPDIARIDDELRADIDRRNA